MATIRPFKALRPAPALAARICELPYDVMSSEEAREVASGNPLSFLRVSKPEIDLPPGTDAYSPEVYAKGAENFQRLIREKALIQDSLPHFYFYRQIMDGREQIGLVGAASCDEYTRNIIKKHELTRIDKEDDRVRHIETLRAQTGPVFLVYRDRPAIDEITRNVTAGDPSVDFTAADGVRHTAWVVDNEETTVAIRTEFERVPNLYIADGHHRSAAAARVWKKWQGAGESASFLSVIFPDTRVRILPYNRVLKDLNGLSIERFAERLRELLVPAGEGRQEPREKHEVTLYMGGRWQSLKFRPGLAASVDPAENLDVALLQKLVLGPLLGIDDPRTSKRIHFVGGIRGTAELEKLVDSSGNACAFAMFPTSVEDLMLVADKDGIMPPKSTWFEPKLRDAMFCHIL